MGCSPAETTSAFDDPAVAICELLLTSEKEAPKPAYKRVTAMVEGYTAILIYTTTVLNTAPLERRAACTYTKNAAGLYEVTSVDNPLAVECMKLRASISARTIATPKNDDERLALSDKLRDCLRVPTGKQSINYISELKAALEGKIYPIEPTLTKLVGTP